MRALVAVCIGGAVGSGARYLATLGAHRMWGSAAPYGTFSVNVLGSFLLGFLLTAWHDDPAGPSHLRLALGTGVLGGFTTYSTFNYETLDLFAQGATRAGFLYVVGTFLSCLLAGLAGVFAGRVVAG